MPEIEPRRELAIPAPEAKHQIEEAAEPTEPVDWSTVDLGSALREIKSEDKSLATRALRKLHLRWWHASATRMKNILVNVGCSEKILQLCQEVCDTCRICRLWRRPNAKSMSHITQAENFNQRVQLDLLFVGDFIILHLCD